MGFSANGGTRVQENGVGSDMDAVGWKRLAFSMVGTAWTESAALRTVAELQVPKILATHAMPPDYAMSAHELLRHMPGATNPNSNALQQLLQLLACRGLFTEHLDADVDNPDCAVVRRYALNAIGQQLVGDNPADSMANFVFQMTLGPHIAATLPYLGESILTSADAFTLAHGVNYFEYMAKRPDVLAVFQNAMAERSKAETGPLLLTRYKGFEKVRSLVDVGGGNGAIVAQIVRHFPHITRAINYDLPEVIALSPAHPGVEHVGGDMFASIPTGCDAVFMKKLLHDWDDEACVKILKNCHEVLEVGGKVILVEGVLSSQSATAKSSKMEEELVMRSSVIMMAHCVGGKERSERDFKRLVTAAGFQDFELVCKLDVSYVMEAYK